MKVYGGQRIKAGGIIVRQLGTVVRQTVCALLAAASTAWQLSVRHCNTVVPAISTFSLFSSLLLFWCARLSHCLQSNSTVGKFYVRLRLAHKPVAAEGILLWSQFHPGDFVGCGKDHTLYALKDGIVMFKKTKYMKKVRAGQGYVVGKGLHSMVGAVAACH